MKINGELVKKLDLYYISGIYSCLRSGKDRAEMSSILVKYDLDPLCGKTAAEAIALITEKLSGRVEQAYYFGSFNTPAFNKNSDIDLLLVTETNTPFVERSLEYADLLDLFSVMDILVYTAAEFSKLTTNPSPGFWKSVVSSLVRII